MTRAAGTPAGRAQGTPAGTASGSSKDPAPALDAAAPAEVPPPSAGRPPRRRPSWWLLGAVGAVALAALLATALLLTRPTDDELRSSALDAAERYTTSLTSYDARTLDEDVARVKRVATPEFASEYERTITELREQISSGQLVSVGTVVGRGVERLQDDTAVVLVAVDQQVTTAGQATRTEANRVRITLAREDGRWLLGDVERL